MITAQNISKNFGRIEALAEVSFEIPTGEIVGFLGPNGAGKTTLMRLLTSYLKPSKGKITVDGFDVVNNSLDVRRKVGYLPETPPLYPEMTVRDYLKFAAQLKDVSAKNVHFQVEKALSQCQLNNVQNQAILTLSKGYRQRVGIAQAIIHDPQVLILDEPTIGLDPKQIAEIRHLIKELGGEHTVILSTHILPEVTMTCQRVIIINEGKIVAIDSYESLSGNLRKSEKTFIKLSKIDEDIFKKLEMIKGLTHINRENLSENSLIVESEVGVDTREEIASICVKNNYGLLEMRPVVMSLEDIFLKLTTEEKGVN